MARKHLALARNTGPNGERRTVEVVATRLTREEALACAEANNVAMTGYVVGSGLPPLYWVWGGERLRGV